MKRPVADLEPGTVVRLRGETEPSTVVAIRPRKARASDMDVVAYVRTGRGTRTLYTYSTSEWEVLEESPAQVSTP